MAKAEATSSPEQLGGMLRTLLANRFKLSAHRETHEMPIYTLVMSRTDGAFGTRLRRSEVSEEACAARRRFAGASRPHVPGRITAVGWSMEQLVNALMPFAGRVVLDKTGRVGLYDADLEWTPDQIPRPPADDPDPPRFDPNGLALFTALQEQLGLKLDSARGPVDVLVVDQVAKPTED